MVSNRSTVGKGMYFMFIGAIIELFSFIPLVGWIILLASAAVSLYGLVIAGKGHENFKFALYCTVVNMVIAVINHFISSTILSIAAMILSMMVIYFVCSAAAALLIGLDDKQSEMGTRIWKLYLICTLIMIICDLLIWMLPLIAGTIMVLVGIVGLIATILYLIFLYQAQKVLQAA